MNIARLIGIDNLADKYSYGKSRETGYTSTRRLADKWVSTTCGYCSVGCGIEIGVRDGRAVATRPDSSHAVNRGSFAPRAFRSTTFWKPRPD